MAKSSKKPTRFEKLAHLEAAIGYCKNFRAAVDVGAHIGLWSREMAHRFKRVWAFEPWPSNQEAWRHTMKAFPNAVLFKEALAARNFQARMEGEGHSKHYIVEDKIGDINVRTLDGFAFQHVDLIKTDCEGADLLALKGAEQTIKRCKPVLIVETYPRYERRFQVKPGEMVRYVESLGAKQVAQYWCDVIFTF